MYGAVGCDAVIAAGLGDVLLAVEPARQHDFLPEETQDPTVSRRAARVLHAGAGYLLNECEGNVERGVISDHVEPSGSGDTLGRELF